MRKIVTTCNGCGTTREMGMTVSDYCPMMGDDIEPEWATCNSESGSLQFDLCERCFGTAMTSLGISAPTARERFEAACASGIAVGRRLRSSPGPARPPGIRLVSGALTEAEIDELSKIP